ncbi:MAG: LLM class flavin-dependent oxidoreductase [Pseudomonadota bacterium]
MKFSLHVSTRVSDWQLVKEFEDLGYDAAWIPDTQMMWSDCYATMALAAANTSKIKIGTGVAIPGTRIAPTTAAAIATINQLAPGRTFLGIGTGHTAMRVMGQNPMPLKEFREYIRVVKGMLNNEEVDFTYRGKTTALVWQDHGEGFRNTEDQVPIYIAANGPKALELVGEMGDGLVSAFAEDADVLKFSLDQINKGADKIGRKLPSDFYTTSLSNAIVLRPGETLKSERVIDAASSWVVTGIHFVYEIWRWTKNDEVVPEYMKNIWEEYCDHVKSFDLPEEKWHQRIHQGHCSWCPPEERKFVKPELMEGTTMIGGPSELAERVRGIADLGLSEISLLPGLHHVRDTAKDFAEQVIPLV